MLSKAVTGPSIETDEKGGLTEPLRLKFRTSMAAIFNPCLAQPLDRGAVDIEFYFAAKLLKIQAKSEFAAPTSCIRTAATPHRIWGRQGQLLPKT
jgi:hypothetical protein